MKINPDDPWYPVDFESTGHDTGVTIRLKLAAEMMKSAAWFGVWFGDASPKNIEIDDFIDGVLEAADAMIERANRDG